MIPSTSPSDRNNRPDALIGSGSSQPRLAPPRADRLSTENAAHLRSALASQPAVRPDVVARARALAADPSYPPLSVLRSVGAMILASPDLSEDQN